MDRAIDARRREHHEQEDVAHKTRREKDANIVERGVSEGFEEKQSEALISDI